MECKPTLLYVNHPESGELLVGENTPCPDCGGVIVPKQIRNTKRKNLRDSKKWSRISPLCHKCDGHGEYVQAAGCWRRKFKNKESFMDGDYPDRPKRTLTKIEEDFKKFFANYTIPEGLEAFIKGKTYNEAVEQLQIALVYAAMTEHKTPSKAATALGITKHTVMKRIYEREDEVNHDARHAALHVQEN